MLLGQYAGLHQQQMQQLQQAQQVKQQTEAGCGEGNDVVMDRLAAVDPLLYKQQQQQQQQQSEQSEQLKQSEQSQQFNRH